MSRASLEDPRRDLWIRFADESTPVVPNGDAVGAVVRRTADALVVTVRYVDIEPRANEDWGVEFGVDIPGDDLERDVTWSEYQYADTHRWDREAGYVKLSSEDSLGERCRGLRGKPDFGAETVTVRVPDRCFEDARWIVVDGLSARSSSRGGRDAVDSVGTDGPAPQRTPRLVEPS